jgi:hypothetical protein
MLLQPGPLETPLLPPNPGVLLSTLPLLPELLAPMLLIALLPI